MAREVSVSIPELGLVAVTRGMIGFGAGLLLANKIPRKKWKYIGLPLFVGGVLSTIPIVVHLFRGKGESAGEGDSATAKDNGANGA